MLSRYHLPSLLGISFALCLPLVACGADNDVGHTDQNTTPQPAAQTDTDPQTNTDPQTSQGDENLANADQLTSGDTTAACAASACSTPPLGTVCCTGAEDVTANRAVVADKCGADMSQFGFPGCTQRDQPGVLDTACPAVEFPPGTPPMAGCCTTSGHCGGMETFIGFGCTSNADASTWVACGH
jgi:hypothetical protein